MANQMAKWTVMVYLAGDNNLDGAGIADLKEMKAAGSDSSLHIVAQFDRIGNKGTTKRYHIQKGGELAADVVQDLGETNCGDPAVLADFLTWAASTYPAEHYLAVIWNHGSGWDDENVYRLTRSLNMDISRKGQLLSGAPARQNGWVPYSSIRSVSQNWMARALFNTSVEHGLKQRAIAFDDQARDFLDNLELTKVFSLVTAKLGRKIDVLGMDACLMNMIEVHYQLRNAADFCVGSQEVEPGDGWPYNKILAELAAKPSMTPEQLSGVIVDKYLKSYRASDSVTQSACCIAKADAVLKAIDCFAKTLTAGLSSTTVRLAIWQARTRVQEYEVPEYVDIVDFCTQLQTVYVTKEIKAASASVIDALTKSGMVIKSGWKGADVKNSHGLSIYFPTKKISKLYARLDFVKKTSWGKFLKAYVAAMGR